MQEIKLTGLPKISLNKWYAGQHWTARKRIKDNYTLLIKDQCYKTFSKRDKYEVDYKFYFKLQPLDASNCVAMVKLIEDIIFEDDKFDIVKKISITSRSSKGENDYVLIQIFKL
jgi:hypothetical protein